MPDTGDQVARRLELGTVLYTFPAGDKPDGYEGDWPETGRRMAVVHWPGRKKLAVEPAANLITVQR